MCAVVVSFTDGERPMEGTDTSHKRDSRSSDKYRKSEDASNSQEEENTVAIISLIGSQQSKCLFQFHPVEDRIHHAGMDGLLRNCATGCRVDEAFTMDDLVDSISADTSGLRCGHVQLRIVFITPGKTAQVVQEVPEGWCGQLSCHTMLCMKALWLAGTPESPVPPLIHDQNEDGIEALKPIYFRALVGGSSWGLVSLKRFLGLTRGQGQ
ncbi:hypothetical protein DPX16_7447 [Anabarilius grahami]|uniref:Uncharacterized protein n=1 Tax=Anabarilius grahami TaxID=495550 RepID=A0A3N0YKC5_ANAGA|nr:hypothetical protein DPX16_7447 [Anabarilius grahami]